MKYLVLQDFRSFGKLLTRGSEVDESEVRSPLLRQSEGKITPAVSSFTAPPVPGTENTGIGERVLEEVDDKPESSAGADKKQSFKITK